MHPETIAYLAGAATAIVAVAAVLYFSFIMAKRQARRDGYHV